jgi:sulfur-oxidizing protein SoxX
MKIFQTTAIIAAMSLAGSVGAQVAPTEVSFDEGAVAQSVTGGVGDPAAGALIVGDNSTGNCVACHQVSALPDVPFQGDIAPMLDGAGDRWSEAELRGILVNAKLMFEGTMMPAFYKTDGFIRPGNAYTGKAADDTFGPILSAQQIEDVVAYLTTLKE